MAHMDQCQPRDSAGGQCRLGDRSSCQVLGTHGLDAEGPPQAAAPQPSGYFCAPAPANCFCDLPVTWILTGLAAGTFGISIVRMPLSKLALISF